MALCVDISNYSGRLSEAQVESLVAGGVALVVVRASLETGRGQREIAGQQMALLRGRLPFQVYAWCYWDASPEETARETRDLIAPYIDGYYVDPTHGRIAWLDAEDAPPAGVDVADWLERN